MTSRYNLFLLALLGILFTLSLAGCGGGGGGSTLSWVVSTFSDYSGPSWGMVFDSSNNLYVVDPNNRVIKITSAGVSSVFASGSTYFNIPIGITVDSANNLYVSNDQNHDIMQILPAGTVSLYNGTTGSSGSSNTAPITFNRPYGLALHKASQVLYIADAANAKVRKIDMSTGTVTDFATSPGIYGVAVDSAGNVYTCSGSSDGFIRKFASTGGTATDTYTLPLNPDAPQIDSLAVDSSGNILAVDYHNHIIWKITPAGVISTFAGTPGTPGLVNAAALSARFSSPRGITIGSDGSIYIADSDNNVIRKITLQ